jgi:hypothetical protein
MIESPLLLLVTHLPFAHLESSRIGPRPPVRPDKGARVTAARPDCGPGLRVLLVHRTGSMRTLGRQRRAQHARGTVCRPHGGGSRCRNANAGPNGLSRRHQLVGRWQAR